MRTEPNIYTSKTDDPLYIFTCETIPIFMMILKFNVILTVNRR